jgi:hypothetical protein
MINTKYKICIKYLSLLTLEQYLQTQLRQTSEVELGCQVVDLVCQAVLLSCEEELLSCEVGSIHYKQGFVVIRLCLGHVDLGGSNSSLDFCQFRHNLLNQLRRDLIC